MENQSQKITPFLWFNGRVEEAVNFYTTVFKNARTISMNRVGDKILTATFQLEGQEFMILDGGSMFQFNPSVSFFVKCATQEEVDYYWNHLMADGGKEQPCGWLVDKFGLSWQIIPDVLGKVLGGSDREGAQRAMQAMMKMHKLDVKVLQDAYDKP